MKVYTSDYQPGGDPTQLRKDLVEYIRTNEKDMNTKLLVMFQRAVNFPDTCLAEISLARCGMRECDWPHFMRLVFAGRNASSLQIQAVTLSLTGFNAICRSIEVLKKLQRLSLSDLGLGFYLLPDFILSLRPSMSLAQIDLSGNVLGFGHISELLPVLLSLPLLLELTLDRNEIDDKGATLLAEKMGEFPQLQTLSIRLNLLTHIGIGLLDESARKLSKMQLVLEQFKNPNDVGKQISESLI